LVILTKESITLNWALNLKTMDYSVIIRSPLFRGMTPEEVMSALTSTPYRIRKFKTGSMISMSGEPVNSFMMVIEGVVKGEMVDFSGRIIKIEDIPASGTLASAFIFGSRNRFPVNVVAISDTKLLIIDKVDFLKFLKINDKILVNFLDMISNRSQFLSEKIKFLSFKTIKGKLAQYILQAAGPDKSEIRLAMTQNELAEYFGVARPSIARVISEMEEEGVIVTKGKYLKITDKKRLTELTIE
jgi:CRP/FNR family transcriptional regulator, dissimilatory nitrate respiration regulator